MRSDFRAIVELGCQCGAPLELAMEEVRAPFECPACDHEHVLSADQLEAIEAAFGRALIMAHNGQGEDEPSIPLLH